MVATNPLDAIEWSNPCLIPQGPPMDAAAIKTAKKKLGYLPDYLSGFNMVPWFYDSLFAFGGSTPAYISQQLADLVALVVSQDNSCRYCYGIARTLLQLTGMSEVQVRKLEQDFHTLDLAAPDKAALALARKVSRANPRPMAEDGSDALAAGNSKLALAEIVALAGASVYQNRAMTMSAAQPAPIEQMIAGPLAFVKRPLMGMMFKLMRKPGQPMPLTDAQKQSPFSQVLRALDGAPNAAIFANALLGMVESQILPLRTKALIFAVIARTLQCQSCERAAVAFVESQGIAKAAAMEVLDRLSSPVLTPLETMLIPLARDTVRGQPNQIQPKLRQMRDKVKPDEFVEFIAVASLANAMARMSCMLDIC